MTDRRHPAPRSRRGRRLARVATLGLGAGALAVALDPASAAVARLSPADPTSRAASTIETRFLANAGVIVADGGRRVAIDLLFGAGLPDYPAVEPAERARLESAEGEARELDLLLATHSHADHFDAAAVAGHLAANPDALFVSTPQAVAALLAQPGGEALRARARGLLPAEGEARERLAWRGIRVAALNLHHGREMKTPVEHLGFVIELGGRKIVHLGDTAATEAELARAFAKERGAIDLAFVPYWRLLDADERESIRRALDPKRLAAMHLPHPSAPADWFGTAGSLPALRLLLAREWPGIVVLDRAEARFELGG